MNLSRGEGKKRHRKLLLFPTDSKHFVFIAFLVLFCFSSFPYPSPTSKGKSFLQDFWEITCKSTTLLLHNLGGQVLVTYSTIIKLLGFLRGLFQIIFLCFAFFSPLSSNYITFCSGLWEDSSRDIVVLTTKSIPKPLLGSLEKDTQDFPMKIIWIGLSIRGLQWISVSG